VPHVLVVALLASALLAPGEQPPRSPALEHALVVSVDGLRSDALLAWQTEALPAFTRLLGGSATLNARCDPDYSITLPNHASMLTGRPVLGPDGHAYVKNEKVPDDKTLHERKGAYVASFFDVAHDRGWHTALLSGKEKFALYDHSYDAENGAPDKTPGSRREVMVHPAGFEPATSGSEDRSSIQLSYGCPDRRADSSARPRSPWRPWRSSPPRTSS
jgi:hypothetical protein